MDILNIRAPEIEVVGDNEIVTSPISAHSYWGARIERDPHAKGGYDRRWLDRDRRASYDFIVPRNLRVGEIIEWGGKSKRGKDEARRYWRVIHVSPLVVETGSKPDDFTADADIPPLAAIAEGLAVMSFARALFDTSVKARYAGFPVSERGPGNPAWVKCYAEIGYLESRARRTIINAERLALRARRVKAAADTLAPPAPTPTLFEVLGELNNALTPVGVLLDAAGVDPEAWDEPAQGSRCFGFDADDLKSAREAFARAVALIQKAQGLAQ